MVKTSPKVRLQLSNSHQLYTVLQRLELDTMTTLDQQTKTNGTLSRRVSNVRILEIKLNAICNLENSNVALARGWGQMQNIDNSKNKIYYFVELHFYTFLSL